jgi:hypothetical protein
MARLLAYLVRKNGRTEAMEYMHTVSSLVVLFWIGAVLMPASSNSFGELHRGAKWR